MRAVIIALMLTVATQAGADTVKELFEKRDVSRLEFTLFKIEQSLLPELQSYLSCKAGLQLLQKINAHLSKFSLHTPMIELALGRQ